MGPEFIVLEKVRTEAEWLLVLYPFIVITKAIPRAKNNGNSRYICLKHNIVKHLIENRVIIYCEV